MSINEIHLPKYSLAEELLNAISHGIGALLMIVGMVLMLAKTVPSGDAISIISVAIYGVSILLMFTISCIYHSLGRNSGKKVLRVLDHNMIFLAIAGTYTPYTLITLRQINVFNWGVGTVGYLIFAFVWACSIIGIIFNSINIKKFLIPSIIIYLVEGWCVIFAFFPLWNAIGNTGSLLLLFGGVAYTLGVILYAWGKKRRYMHSIFHLFVFIGAALMFFSIYLYVI